MPLYSEDVLEEVRLGNDIVDVVSQYVPLKVKGGRHLGLCPFHREKSPSFSVSADRQMYHCFGCGAGGNVFGFVMRIENFSFMDAIKHLADRIHYSLPETGFYGSAKKNTEIREILYEMNTKAAKFFYDLLNSKDGEAAVRYLDSRMISLGARRKFGLGFSGFRKDELYNYLKAEKYDDELILKSGLAISGKNGGHFDRFSTRLMFPIFDPYNKIVGFGGRAMDDRQPKYLNSPDTPLFDKSRNLYSINYARQAKTEEIIIVEGYIDVISLYQAGFKNVVAALGTAFNIQHARLLKKYCKTVVLLFDSDQAGENAALRAIPILIASGLAVKVLQLAGAKDPDEYIKAYGAAAFADALSRATHHTFFEVECVKKNYNLGNPSEKVKFTKEAAEIVSKLESAVERDVYSREIAEKTGISESVIKEEVLARADLEKEGIVSPRYINKPTNIPDKTMTKGVDEAKRNILYLMAENIEICRKIKNVLVSEEMGEKVYELLFGIISNQSDIGKNLVFADVVSHFESIEEQDIVSSIFSVNFEYADETSLYKALNDQIKIIKKAYIVHRISKTTDMEELHNLVKIKGNLKDSYI